MAVEEKLKKKRSNHGNCCTNTTWTRSIKENVIGKREHEIKCCINTTCTRSIKDKVTALGKREHAIQESALWSGITGPNTDSESVPRPTKSRLQSLLLVSLIYQLDLLIRSFDDSRKIQKTEVGTGKESKSNADIHDGGMDV
uniref:Uncharacterized protein n=1 Tax=Cryptomonas curvata TaxID=233186 RepID=A0A7S0QFX8_9CRYP